MNTSRLSHAFAHPVYLMLMCVRLLQINNSYAMEADVLLTKNTMFTITRRTTPNYSRMSVFDGLRSAAL